MWRFRDRGRLEQGYPISLFEMFPQLPKDIKKVDAAYQRPDGMIILFTGIIIRYAFDSLNLFSWIQSNIC